MAAYREVAAGVNFEGHEGSVYTGSYENGATALVLSNGNPERGGEVIAVASVNVAGVSENLGDGYIVLKDYSENTGMLDSLARAGVVEDTGERVAVGFAVAPVVRLAGANG